MKALALKVVFLLVACLNDVTVAIFDPTVCSRDNVLPGTVPGGPAKPTFPDQFQSRIELTILNKNQTTEMIEYYDGVNNRGTIVQTDFNVNLRALYDYTNDEFIMDYPDQKACGVVDLGSTEQRFLLGYQMVNGRARIFSAARALHWSDPQIDEGYAGRDTIRGIAVDHWQSCQYWGDEGASMQVHWYFTASDGWQTSNGGTQLPVRCWVKGTVSKPGIQTYPFEHYYEFFQFRDTIVDGTQVFEPPETYPCLGRVTPKQLPKPNTAFTFTSESVNYATQIITYMKEEFDLTTKLVRYTYKPPTANKVIEIHDFNTGVAYVTDPMTGNCSYKQIESGQFDVKQSDASHIRMRTAAEFFSFDSTKYAYIGKHKTRLIDCDAWIATRTDWPPGVGVNSTWTWYFASDDWIESSGTMIENGEPISLKVEIPELALNLQYNLYNFHNGEPDIFDFDVSSCYNFRNRVYVTFTLPGVYNNAIAADKKAFKYSLLLTVIGTTAVSPLRIAHLNFVMSDTDITVEFEILDVAPMVGDVQNPAQELPLTMAVATLNETITAQRFSVPVIGGETVVLVAHSDSLQMLFYESGSPQTGQTTGYTPGAMAAVGITMPIVGGAIGAAAAFFFFK